MCGGIGCSLQLRSGSSGATSTTLDTKMERTSSGLRLKIYIRQGGGGVYQKKKKEKTEQEG